MDDEGCASLEKRTDIVDNGNGTRLPLLLI